MESLPVSKSQHIPVLDSLRAIAALSVVLFHFVTGPINFVTNEFVLDVFHIGLYGVQLFFVISGFVIPWSISRYDYKISNYFKFLLKRFLRLEPPYLVSIGLVILFFFLRKLYTDVPDDQVLSVNQLLLHLGYLIPFTDYTWINKVYWTLSIEFQFYLFMGLFYFVIASKLIQIRIGGYILLFAISFIGGEHFLLYWLPVFLLGNMLFLFLTKRINSYEFYSIVALALLHVFIFLPGPTFYVCLFPVISILFFHDFSIPVLNWIGKISYSIYLIHTIVGYAFINVFSHYAHTAFTKIVVVILGIGTSIFCSYLMYLVIEKPSQKLSSKIKL